MATITLKGNPIHTIGDLPAVGEKAKEFTLTGGQLNKVSLSELLGTRVVLNIFPSLETSTCAASVRRFNQIAGEIDNTKVLCISKDLPFAQTRFCGAEGLENVITLSDFATGAFGKDYGVEMIDGPLQGLLSRSVVILDEHGVVIYNQQVPEVSIEPDYEKALEHLQ